MFPTIIGEINKTVIKKSINLLRVRAIETKNSLSRDKKFVRKEETFDLSRFELYLKGIN